jgi:hypothetical protein
MDQCCVIINVIITIIKPMVIIYTYNAKYNTLQQGNVIRYGISPPWGAYPKIPIDESDKLLKYTHTHTQREAHLRVCNA